MLKMFKTGAVQTTIAHLHRHPSLSHPTPILDDLDVSLQLIALRATALFRNLTARPRDELRSGLCRVLMLLPMTTRKNSK